MRITSYERVNLSSHDWYVSTTNERTKNAIKEYLSKAQLQQNENSIFYNGQCLEGFRVQFDVIEYLATHKTNCGYEYTVYHKKPKARNWSRWQRRSPAQQFFQRISRKFNPRSALLH